MREPRSGQVRKGAWELILWTCGLLEGNSGGSVKESDLKEGKQRETN